MEKSEKRKEWLKKGKDITEGTLIAVVIMVPFMTYVVMPSVTRLLRPWLSKERLF